MKDYRGIQHEEKEASLIKKERIKQDISADEKQRRQIRSLKITITDQGAELAKRDKEIEELKAEIALRGKRMELLWKVLMLDESEQYHYEGYDELRSWFDNDGQINPRKYSDD